MHRLLTALFLFVGLLGQAGSPGPAELRLQKDLAYLAGPERKGRGNGSPELDQAAGYLAKRYKAMGLKVQTQRFPFVHRIERLEGKATLGKGETLLPDLEWGKDVEAYGFSADANFRFKPLLFIGYGLKTQGYDDLEGFEYKGKVAIIARNVPQIPIFESLSRMEKGVLSRIQRLEKLGVAAVILLEEEPSVRKLQREEGPLSLKVPVLSMTAQALKGVCGDLNEPLARVRESGKPQGRDFTLAPWSFLDLTLKLKRHEAQVPNLAVTIPGRDPKLKSEVLVLGAHMDHLGLGERHSLMGEAGLGKVHAGADDNASGTAILLELGRRLNARRPKRSVLLLHVSGEEEGLLGSAYWVQNPTVPLPSVKFMLNFDMVGRLDETKPTLLMGGLGAPRTALERAKTFAPEGVTIGGDLGMAVGGSDHMSFAAAKIPTFFFFTGVHTDYHRPSDLPEKLNLKGMLKLADMAQKVIVDLADAPELPAFDPETAKLPTLRDQGPVRVSFGTVPDFTENPKGFRINGTSPGSAAEALGLQAGDILLTFGGKPVKNIYEFQGALSAHKPGDKVKVQWLRGETPMEGEATLKGR